MASDSAYRTGLFALGIELDGEGFHPAAAHRAGREPADLLNPATLTARVQAAENAGFTFASFDDSLAPDSDGPPGRLDAVTRAAFTAATTSTIGLVPVAAATYAEPFHLSSQLASLDYASRGRAGWLVTDDPDTAHTWGATPRITAEEVRRERVDSVEVARRLWDSWEDDAVVRDYATGRFLDRDKLHYADFIGETFAVKGPSIVPRPPQGQVVVFGYGAIGSERPDVALVTGASTKEAGEAVRQARTAGIPRVLVDLEIALDTPDATAIERLADLDALAPAKSTGRLSFSGSATELTALLTELAATADGIRVHPAVLDTDLPILARYVIPALLRTGLAHRPVPGSTLRANLGLARPANRYAKELAR